MKLKDLNIKGSYRQEEDPLSSFYGPCLSISKTYIRAAGYFRSTLINLLPKYLYNFVLNSGKIQLLCSPELNIKDANIIYNSKIERETLTILEIDKMLKDLSSFNVDKIFASLIKFNFLDIKLAYKKNGIFHEKWGILKDSESNKVYFSGSVNETLSAWHQDINFENLDTRCNWKSEEDHKIIQEREEYFNDLWNNSKENIIVEYLSKEAKERIVSKAYSQEEDFIKELELIDYSNNKVQVDKKSLLLKNARKHQKQAWEYWISNSKRALFKHATGSGKTFTGLLALEKHFQRYNFAIVFVPSNILLGQWHDEISKYLSFVKIIKAGDGNNEWKIFKNYNYETTKEKIVVISILNTAIKEQFKNNFSQIQNTFILVDEVHSIGAESFSIILENFSEAPFRLGVSATPERHDNGYLKITDYFGNIVTSCIYTIRDGINDGYLCKYNYFNHIVNLEDDELEEWNDFKKKISILKSKKNKQLEDYKKIENLIFRRSGIAQNAKSKIPVAVDIIKNNYVPEINDRFLVFCNGLEQLNILGDHLADNKIEFMKYYSNQAKNIREETLKVFYDKGGLILSIRCLDEGVDIPLATKALIIASSQNSRQFIQRRGRVLRRSEGKINADIHDILININKDKTTPYFEKELTRALIFAKDASNRYENENKLEMVSFENSIDFDKLKNNIETDVIDDELEIEDD